MRKVLLPYLILMFFSVNAQQWCNTGAKWTYNFYSMASFGYQTLEYEKDTIVLNQPCKKLVGQLIQPIYIGPGVHPLRIDTSNIKPIYTYSNNDSVFCLVNSFFRLIYLFNVQKGDTIYSYNFNLPENSRTGCDSIVQQVIDSTGTFILNNDTLKMYVTRPINYSSSLFYPYYVIIAEKLGAIDNYFSPYFTCYTDGDAYTLRCYSDSAFSTYQTSSETACNYIYTSITNEDINNVSVHPNPTQTTLNVTVNQDSKIQFASILDLVRKQWIRMDDLRDSNNLTFDVRDLPAGVYFIKLTLRTGNILLTKFVKQ